jgi:DNA polymerase
MVEDYLASGFSRPHPELILEESAPEAWRTESVPEARREESSRELGAVAEEVASCVLCGLSVNRRLTVPGEGSLTPSVLFVGEGPGEEEDRTGRPFVGPAGRYLDTWIPPIGLARQGCFIANCVKCRPPQNREPHPDEIGACLPFLERQIRALKPRAICCLGRIAAQTLLGTQESLGSLRGRIHQRSGIPLVATYHPSAVLRDKSLRKPVWEDLKLLRTLLVE